MLHSLFENYIYNSNKRRIMSAVFIPDRRFVNVFALECGVNSRAAFKGEQYVKSNFQA